MMKNKSTTAHTGIYDDPSYHYIQYKDSFKDNQKTCKEKQDNAFTKGIILGGVIVLVSVIIGYIL